MPAMPRDMDLIRTLLLEMEGGRPFFDVRSQEVAAALGIEADGALPREQTEKLQYHLDQIERAGLAEFSKTIGGGWHVLRITPAGHDFLDAVRDQSVWSRTKAGVAEAGGSFTLDLLKALARGFARTQIEKATGLTLDL